MTLIELIKTMFDDFMRERWGDIVALFLIILGTHIVILGHDETVKDLGKGIVSAGLVSLRMTKMQAKNGNGNGSH